MFGVLYTTVSPETKPLCILKKVLFGVAPSEVAAMTRRSKDISNKRSAFQNRGIICYEVAPFAAKVANVNESGLIILFTRNTKTFVARSSQFLRVASFGDSSPKSTYPTSSPSVFVPYQVFLYFHFIK